MRFVFPGKPISSWRRLRLGRAPARRTLRSPGPRSGGAADPADPFLVFKITEALRVVESSSTLFEGLNDAYREHLYWCDPARMPDGLREQLVDLNKALCRSFGMPERAMENVAVRPIDEQTATELCQRLRSLANDLEQGG